MINLKDVDAIEVSTDLIKLNSEYQCLWFDEGEDILFKALTKNKEIVICSIIDDNLDLKITQYFYNIISDFDYIKFLNKQITYLDIIKSKERTYILEQSFDLNSINAYEINVNKIPLDYLPSANSYCP